MDITRCKDQKHSTLDDFYAVVSSGTETVSQAIGKAMLSLLSRLRAIPDKRKVWGLTSHYHLCFLARDSSESPWFVKIIGMDSHNYFIDYLLPSSLAPWPNAYVKGEARSEDEAVEMIITAMKESRGWEET